MEIKAGIAFMYEPEFLDAIDSLLNEEQVDAIEWAFDSLIQLDRLPDQHFQILNKFSKKNALYGHGVFYSPMTAKWLSKHENWINKLSAYFEQYKFQHVSEHFAFMSSHGAHDGMPLPFYIGDEAIDITINRMKILAEKTGVPIGLENLAFAFTESEIYRQAEAISNVLVPINGFLLLDLHNVYCQSQNFGVSMQDIIALYPLDRIKEIHISGGSWQKSSFSEKQFRRDSHNSPVPDEIFVALEDTLAKTPNVDLVILERNGNTFTSDAICSQFRSEFLELKKISKRFKPACLNNFQSLQPINGQLTLPIDNIPLFDLQNQLLRIFENENSASAILKKIQISPDLGKLYHANEWSLDITDAAMQILDAWGLDSQWSEIQAK